MQSDRVACKFVFVFATLWLRLFCMYLSRSFGKLLACVAYNFRARHKFSHTHTDTSTRARTQTRVEYGAAKEFFGKWRRLALEWVHHTHSSRAFVSISIVIPYLPPPPYSYQFKFRSIDHTATQTYSYKCAHTLYLLRDRCLCHSHSAFQAKACVKCKLLKKIYIVWYESNTLTFPLPPFTTWTLPPLGINVEKCRNTFVYAIF